MDKSSLSVNILGSSFTVRSKGDPEHLQRVVSYLESKVEEVRQKYSNATSQDPVKICLLAGLNVADELLRGRGRAGSDQEALEVEKIADRLIDVIDESLMER